MKPWASCKRVSQVTVFIKEKRKEETQQEYIAIRNTNPEVPEFLQRKVMITVALPVLHTLPGSIWKVVGGCFISVAIHIT